MKCLENAENLPGIKLDSPKPAIKKKWKFERKSFKPFDSREKIKIDYIKGILFTGIIDLKQNRFGLEYRGKFIDVYDTNTGSFMYRIKPLDDRLKMCPLIDGTFLIIGSSKYVVSILDNKAIQKLYETDIDEFILQLCDERILCRSGDQLCIYEKDNNGIFKKKVSTKYSYSDRYYKQVRDNVIVARDLGGIRFFDANTLEKTDYIKYPVFEYSNSKMGMITENLLVIKSNNIYRQYDLINIDEKEIEELVLDDEYNYLDPETNELCGKTRKEPNIEDMIEFPDYSIYIETYRSTFIPKYSFAIKWNAKKRDFDGVSLPYFKNENNRQADVFLLKFLENGGAFFKVVISETQNEYYFFK